MTGNYGFRRVIEYLWDSEPEHTDFENEIICLGKSYSPVPQSTETNEGTGSEPTSSSGETHNAWPADFLADVEARIWMSYRTNFPLIPRAKKGPSPVTFGGIFRGSGLDVNGFTSDVGWGCMIRTSQSLLANCLSIFNIGRDWRKPDNGLVDPREAEILLLFMDTPAAPYSLHNFVHHGETYCGKMPGEWFGPSAAASSIKALQTSFSPDLQVYISSGSDVYEKHFLSTAIDNEGNFRPTLILLGLRLGIDSVNHVYWDSLKQFLSCPQAVGIAGGRPSSSHYFFGYQGDYLFYLDPHYPKPTRNFASPEDLTADAVQDYHNKRIRKLHLKEMDPSMLVGLLIKDKADWESWKGSVIQSNAKKIIHISPEPAVLRRSSMSIGSDDEEGFIDVLIDPEEETLDTEGKAQESTAFKESKEDSHIPINPEKEIKPEGSSCKGDITEESHKADVIQEETLNSETLEGEVPNSLPNIVEKSQDSKEVS